MLTFREFATANIFRCEATDGFNHDIDSWSTSDWMVAVMGELGEAANIIKKLNRVRDNIPGNEESPAQLRAALRDEIADAFIYLDLLATALDFNLDDAVISKWNRTSAKIGYPGRLGEYPDPTK